MSSTSSVSVLDPSSAIQPVDFEKFTELSPSERAEYDSIESIAINSDRVQDFIDNYIHLFPNITKISIIACEGFTDKMLDQILKKKPNIVSVHLQGNNMDSFVVNANNKLEEIDLTSNQLERVNVSRCSSLKKLNLAGNPIDPTYLFLPETAYKEVGSELKPNIKIIADNFNETSEEVIGSFLASAGMSKYNDELNKKFGDRPVNSADSFEEPEDQNVEFDPFEVAENEADKEEDFDVSKKTSSVDNFEDSEDSEMAEPDPGKEEESSLTSPPKRKRGRPPGSGTKSTSSLSSGPKKDLKDIYSDILNDL